jgi:type I restriction enzyme S subunit
MDADIFLQQFGHLAQGDGGIKKLRDVILQLAVRGKLVAQNPADEPAEVLLKKIEADKKRLMKEGKIGREKSRAPRAQDDQPYLLPEKWEWARLGAILASIQYGYTASADSTKQEPKLVRITDIHNSRVNWETVPGCDIEADKLPTYKLAENDFLIARTGGTIGKSFLVTNVDFESVFASYLIRIRTFPSFVLPQFLKCYLDSPLYWKQLYAASMGTGQPNVNGTSLGMLKTPLPPLAEQKRIVAKVDELMELCDKLEAEQKAQRTLKTQAVQSTLHHLTSAENLASFSTSLNILERKFSNWFDDLATVKHLRTTILQLAVQGKLVPQNPTDEPASNLLKRIEAEKKRLKIKVNTPAIAESMELYPLPNTWMWHPLGQLISMMDSGWSPACEQHPAHDESSWGVLKTTAVQVMRYLDFENKALPAKLQPRPEIEVKVGDLLITRAGPRNRVGISCLVEKTREKLMISDKIIRFHLVGDLIYERYISLCLNAGETNRYIELAKSGMADSQLNISQDKLKAAPIPLPPLAEQKRIVAKVDELMTLCDQLEAHITHTQTLNTHLMESLIHRMTEAA